MPQNPLFENSSSSEELPARGDSVESYKEKAAKPAMSPKEMKAMEDKMKMVPHDPETTNSPDTGNFGNFPKKRMNVFFRKIIQLKQTSVETTVMMTKSATEMK